MYSSWHTTNQSSPAMAATSKSKVILKLLIDRRSQKVLFAEAGKDFVDFLFSFLALPVGTITRLLSKDSMVGCLGNLYDSVEKLSEAYMQPSQHKDLLLKPKASLSTPEVPLLGSHDGDDGWVARKIYMCPNYTSHRSWTDNPDTICPQCSLYMDTEVPHVGLPKKAAAVKEVSAAGGGGEGGGGYVKGLVTYMVMDDLVVKPASAISCITLFNKLNVKEDGALEERFIDIGLAEGLELLKASLHCKTVLTSVFLGKSIGP